MACPIHVFRRDPIFGDGRPVHVREHRPSFSLESLHQQAVSPLAGSPVASPSVQPTPSQQQPQQPQQQPTYPPSDRKKQPQQQPTYPPSDRKTTLCSMSSRITIKGLSTRPVLLVDAFTNERQFFISGNAAAAFLGVRPAVISIARKQHGCIGSWHLSDPQPADYPVSFDPVLLPSPDSPVLPSPSSSGAQKSREAVSGASSTAVRFGGILDGQTMAPVGQLPGIVDRGSTMSVGVVKSGSGSSGSGSVSRKRRRVSLSAAAGKKNKPRSKHGGAGGSGKYAQKEVLLTPVYSNAGNPTHPAQRFSTIKAAAGFLGLRPDTITAAVKDQRAVKGYRITYLVNNAPCEYHHGRSTPRVVDRRGADGAGGDSVLAAEGTLPTSNELGHLVISLMDPDPISDSKPEPEPEPEPNEPNEPGYAMTMDRPPEREPEPKPASSEPEPEPEPGHAMALDTPESEPEPDLGHAMVLAKLKREPEPMSPEPMLPEPESERGYTMHKVEFERVLTSPTATATGS